MRWKPLATAAVVVALAAIGVVAVVDAVRPSAPPAEPAARSSTPDLAGERGVLVGALSEEGIDGTLYYSDPEDDCRVHAVSLPGLEQVPPPPLRACRFELPPDPGTGALPDNAT